MASLVGLRSHASRSSGRRRSLDCGISLRFTDLATMLAIAAASASYMAPAMAPRAAGQVARATVPAMDETIIENALAGTLEEEGAENCFMSEVGWATYLDENAGGSYNMNERPSLAEDGYFTPDVFSNPAEGAHSTHSWIGQRALHLMQRIFFSQRAAVWRRRLPEPSPAGVRWQQILCSYVHALFSGSRSF